MSHYDLTILGGGSGGLTAARIAASLGARTLLVDKESLGGDCLRYGCVPSKSLLHVARLVKQARELSAFGAFKDDFQPNYARITASIHGVIDRIGAVEQEQVKHLDVRITPVQFLSAQELQVGDQRVQTRSTIISTGSRPLVPAIEGLVEVGFLTNMDVFDLQKLPRSLVILGGGPIGAELGQAFGQLGVRVTLLQSRDRLLPREDPDVSAAIAEALEVDGVRVITGVQVQKVERLGSQKVVTVTIEEREQRFEAEEILVAAGRQPNLEGLNLKAGDIISDFKKGIQVDEHLRTSSPAVFAIGDVIGTYLFSHVAAYQAGIAVRNALLPNLLHKKVDYRVTPWCTFTDPEAARVGLTYEEARLQHKNVRVITFPWSEIDRAQTERETRGFIKLILAGKKEEIVGAHLVGAHAGEILGEISLAMQKHLTVNDIYNTIHAYPTLSTGFQQATFEAYLSGSMAASNRRLVQTLLKLR